MAVMIDKETKEAVPVTAFLHADQLAKDLQRVNDAARGRQLSVRRHGAGADEELRPVQGADALQARRPDEEVRQDVRRAAAHELRQGRRPTARSRTSRSAAATAGTSCSSPACGSRTCSTTTSAAPSAASSRTRRRKGRSRFCAYNTGHRLAEHHREDAHDGHADQVVRGARPSRDLRRRQEGRAARRPTHNLVLDPEAVAAGKQTDLDEKGIAKNAREEKLRARAEAEEEGRPRTSAMAALYRQHVLKEAAPEPVIQIKGLGGSKKKDRAGSPAQAGSVAAVSFPSVTAAQPSGARPFVFPRDVIPSGSCRAPRRAVGHGRHPRRLFRSALACLA